MNLAKSGCSEGTDRPLHAAFYSPGLPESGIINGIVTYTRIMRDALRELGHAVTIVTPDQIEHADGRIENLPVTSGLSGRLRWLVERQRRNDGSDPWIRLRIDEAFRAARSAGASILEIEESFGWAGWLAGRGMAVVERLHGPHIFVRDEVEPIEKKRLGDLREAAEFASFKKVEAVTAPTQRLLDRMAEHGLDPAISKAIPNPIPVVPQGAAWRADRADLERVLFIGRFDRCKGADVALRSFAYACERRPTLKLVIAGPDEGIQGEDGKVRQFNEFVASEIPPQLRDRIDFRGRQSPQQVAELRDQSAFALIPSRFETFGYSIAEAMAQGMPVLTSDTFGGTEMVRDEEEGRVITIGDVTATGKAILEMTGNAELLSRMGKAAYRRVADWLSPERIARESLAVYRGAIART